MPTKEYRKRKPKPVGQEFRDFQALIEVLRDMLCDDDFAVSPAGRAAKILSKHDNIPPKQG